MAAGAPKRSPTPEPPQDAKTEIPPDSANSDPSPASAQGAKPNPIVSNGSTQWINATASDMASGTRSNTSEPVRRPGDATTGSVTAAAAGLPPPFSTRAYPTPYASASASGTVSLAAYGAQARSYPFPYPLYANSMQPFPPQVPVSSSRPFSDSMAFAPPSARPGNPHPASGAPSHYYY